MARNDSDVTSFLDELKAEDTSFAEYEDRFGALSRFVSEYEYGKESHHMTQADIAHRAHTTQSAISRFESMKHPPTYDLLVRVSRAIGDELFLSPFGSLSMSLPYDLHDKARMLAKASGKPVAQLIQDYVRQGLAHDSFVVCNKGAFSVPIPNEAPAAPVRLSSGPQSTSGHVSTPQMRALPHCDENCESLAG